MENISYLSSILATGFTVAFFHAIIPTHWLPFVTASRTQKWSRSKTLSVTALAGAGHVIVTSGLGLVVVLLGMALDKKIGDLFPLFAGTGLVVLGTVYLYRYFKGQGHEHGHIHLLGGHHHHESVLCFKGEHNGVLIETGNQLIEVSVYETETTCRLRVYFYDSTASPKPSPPSDQISLKLIKTVGCQDGDATNEEIFSFIQKENFLESKEEWKDKKQFKAVILLRHKDHSHEYQLNYNSDESLNEVLIRNKGQISSESKLESKSKSDRMAILSLLALLTFSPCESFLPVYLSGIQYGWTGFIVLSLTLGLATLSAMVLFTWLALTGIEKLKLSWIEKHESAIMGVAMLVLGILVVFFED